MREKKARKLLKKIFKEDAQEIGVFISWLAYHYIKACDVSRTIFLKSLTNSLKTMEDLEKGEALENEEEEIL